MQRELVLPAATAVWRALKPACEHVVIAGSLRRGVADVGDIEICACPTFDTETNLLGERALSEQSARFEATLEFLLKSGTLCWDEKLKRRGPWYKRFLLPGLLVPLDLFVTKPGNWGNILAIRTGPAAFSKALVTPIRNGGLMPNDLKQEDGILWRRQRMSRDTLHWQPLVCETEEVFFTHLRLPCLAPAQRTEEAICGLRRLADAGGVKA